MSGYTGYAPNVALVTNDSNVVVVSNVTTTELGYLRGVTSSVQTQLNAVPLPSNVLTENDWTANTTSLAVSPLTFTPQPNTTYAVYADAIVSASAGSVGFRWPTPLLNTGFATVTYPTGPSSWATQRVTSDTTDPSVSVANADSQLFSVHATFSTGNASTITPFALVAKAASNADTTTIRFGSHVSYRTYKYLTQNADVTVVGNANFDGSAFDLGQYGNANTIYVNGTLVIDGDTMYGQTARTLGNIVPVAQRPCAVHIDASQMWEVPFVFESGPSIMSLGPLGTNVATGQTSGAFGEVSGIWATTSAVGAAGAAVTPTIPTNGWLKFRSVTGTFASNEVVTLPGGAQVRTTTPGKRSWVHVIGYSNASVSYSTTGFLRVQGDWYGLGVTTGSPNQAVYLPVHEFVPGVQIETAPNSGVYEWYLNASVRWDRQVANVFLVPTDARGKYFGQGHTARNTIDNFITLASPTYGYAPPAGCKIRIPNVFLSTTAALGGSTAVVAPACVDTLYSVSTTKGGFDYGGGIVMRNAVCSWPINVKQYGGPSLTLSDTTFGSLQLQSIGSPVYVTNCATTSRWYDSAPCATLDKIHTDISFVGCRLGGLGTALTTDAATGNLTFESCAMELQGAANVANSFVTYERAGANLLSLHNRMTRLGNCAVVGPIVASNGSLVVSNLAYADVASHRTTESAFAIRTVGTYRTSLNGFSLLAPNAHPSLGVVYPQSAFVSIKNVGNVTTPLNGTWPAANAMECVANVAAHTGPLVMERVYASNVAYGIVRSDASDQADAPTRLTHVHFTGNTLPVQLGRHYAFDNAVVRGCKWAYDSVANAVYAPLASTHWEDRFVGNAGGQLVVYAYADPVANSTGVFEYCQRNGAYRVSHANTHALAFSANANVVWTMPDYALGHTALMTPVGNNVPAVLCASNTQNGNAANASLRHLDLSYQIDLNDGSQWSGWKFLMGVYEYASVGNVGNAFIRLSANTAMPYTRPIQVGDSVCVFRNSPTGAWGGSGSIAPSTTASSVFADTLSTLTIGLNAPLAANTDPLDFVAYWKDIRSEPVDYERGFKLKVRASAREADVGGVPTQLSHLFIPTTSNLATQATTYPLSPDATGDGVAAAARLTNMVVGSRLQIFNVTSNVEILNTIVTSPIYTNEYSSGYTLGDVVRVRVTYVDGATAKSPFEALATVDVAGWAVRVNQVDHAAYNAAGIDGSGVTEFSAAAWPVVTISGVTTTTVARLVAWWTAQEFTQSGIGTFVGGLVAEDELNVRIVAAVADVKLDNAGLQSVMFTGPARLYRDDGATPVVGVTSSGESLVLYADRVYSGAAATDWTSAERQQIRLALGVSGDTTLPLSGNGYVEAIRTSTDAWVNEWTASERQQVRSALGVSGATMATTGTGVVDNVHSILSSLQATLQATPPTDWTLQEKQQIRWALGLNGETANTTGTGLLDRIFANALAIKAKTDLIPPQPANEATVLTRLAAADYAAPNNAAINLTLANVLSIQAKTDLIPPQPANEATVLTRLAAADYVAPSNQTIDHILANVLSVKTKANLIPPQPANEATVLTRLAAADYTSPNNSAIQHTLANVLAVKATLDALPANIATVADVNTRLAAAQYVPPANDACLAALGNVLAVKAVTDALPANVATVPDVLTRLAAANYVPPNNEAIAHTLANVLLIKSQTDALPLTPANEATLLTRLAAADYVVPHNDAIMHTLSNVLAIKAQTDLLPPTPANETTVLTRLAAVDYTHPDNANIQHALSNILAIKAQTDLLPPTPANEATVLTRLAAANYTLPHNDAIQHALSNIQAIKAQTDLIPPTPANEATVLTRLAAANYIPPDNAAVQHTLANVLLVKAQTDLLPPTPANEATVLTRLALADYVLPHNDAIQRALSNILAVKARTDALPPTPANEATVLTRLAAADYVLPDNTTVQHTLANVLLVKAQTDLLPPTPANELTVLTRLATANYTPPDNANLQHVLANVLEIKARTDALPPTPANEATVLSRLAAADYVVPNNALIQAIALKTANLPADPASESFVATRLATDVFLGDAGAVDWTVAERNQIRRALGIGGVVANTSGVGILDEIRAVTAALPANVASAEQVTSRLAADAYMPPDNATIQWTHANVLTIATKTAALPADPASETAVLGRLAATAYVAPDNATIAAVAANTANILAKTNLLPNDPASATDVFTRLAANVYVAPDNQGIANVLSNVAAVYVYASRLPLDPASATDVQTRLAATDYTSPDNRGIAATLANVAAIRAKTDALPADPASNAAVLGRLAAADYVVPDNLRIQQTLSNVLAVKAQTDLLPPTPANEATLLTRLAAADYTPPNNAGILAVIDLATGIDAKTSALPADPASDTAVLTRLAATDYVLPANDTANHILSNVLVVKSKTDALPADPASDTAVLTRLATAGYTAPANDAMAQTLSNVLLIKSKTDALPADPASNTAVFTRVAAADYTPPDNAAIQVIRAKTDALPADPASNTAVLSRLAAANYVAPLNDVIQNTHANVLVVKTKTDALPSDPASNAAVLSRLAAAAYVVPLNDVVAHTHANVLSIKSKTDALPPDPASETTVLSRLAANVYQPVEYTAIDATADNVAAIRLSTDRLPLDPASDTTVLTRLAASQYVVLDNPTLNAVAARAANIQAKTDALPPDPASETAVLSRLAATAYIADTARFANVETSVANVLMHVSRLPPDPASNAAVLSRLAAAAYVAPDNATIRTTANTANAVYANVTAFPANIATGSDVAAVLANVLLVKAKTDALPPDPASNTFVATRLAAADYDPSGDVALAANLASLNANVNELRANVVIVRAKTDNLPPDPASATQVASRLANVDYVRPDNANILLMLSNVLAVRASTDALPPNVASAQSVAALHATANAIHAKTSQLPADPASETTVLTRLATSQYVAPDNAALMAASATLAALQPNVASIKVKTDALPLDPASETTVQSRLASAAFAQTAADMGSASSTLAATHANVSNLVSRAMAVQTKTDALPSDPASQTTVLAAIQTRLAANAYVVPDNATLATIAANVALVKAKTDLLPSGAAAAASNVAAVLAQVNLVKAKTDALPSDPASEATVLTRLAHAAYTAPDTATLANVAQTTSAIATTATAIKAKTDLLPNDPASESTVLTRLAAAEYVAPDNANVQALHTQATAILGNVLDIKSKTQALPPDPASNTVVLTRLAAADYVAPPSQATMDALLSNVLAIRASTSTLPTAPATAGAVSALAATVNVIKAKTDSLPPDPASNAAVLSRLAAVAYEAPNTAAVLDSIANLHATTTAVRAKTDALPTDPASESTAAATLANVLAVKARTDALPADPASETTVLSRLAATAYAPPDNAGIQHALSNVLAIKVVTDALPANVASQDTLLYLSNTAQSIKTATDALPANVATQHTVNALAANVLLVKAKTDLLPNDPASETAVLSRLAAAEYVAPDNASIQRIKKRTALLPSFI